VDENQFRELLIRTDAASAPPRSKDLIGGAIRRRSRRRRNAAFGAIGACAVVGIVTFQLIRSGVSPRHEAAWERPAANNVRNDEVADAIQLDVATRTVEQLLRDERERAVGERVRRLANERFILREEREAEARHARASAAELRDGEQAGVLRRIVECYAGTGAAVVARERLSAVQ
jgi:hypothetical protein